MKIGLIDVDSHNYPNIPLMKISAYHKQQGNQVEFALPMNKYDVVYQSKVFTFSEDENTCIDTKQFIKGGTGYDLNNKLPEEIESMYPDYGLYGVKEAYGFLTRGCPRNCKFCIVGVKEGLKSVKVANLDKFWNGQKEIVLQDPNLLACENRIELLDQLIESKAKIDVNQGFDIRLMNDEVTDKIMQLNIKMLHFAWDNMKDSEIITKKLREFKQATNVKARKTRVYIITNFDTTIEEDLYRIYETEALGYDPFVMVYNRHLLPRGHIYKKLQRWCCNKFVYRACKKFDEYMKKGA
mgnify:FL=1